MVILVDTSICRGAFIAGVLLCQIKFAIAYDFIRHYVT